MIVLRELINISRPRFWMYVFGPFLVGIAPSGLRPEQLPAAVVISFAIYFLFPANLLIYGVNDLFDADTDLLNDKKQGYETRLAETARRRTVFWIVTLNAPFIILALFLAPLAAVPLAIFVFLSIFYSAPPVRAKSKPFLDSAFNVLYALPGVTAYVALTGEFPTALVIVAAASWTAAMHAYSAVPDIDADRAAGVSTIATFLGARPTLIVCGLLFLAASALSFKYLGYLSVALGAVYLSLIVISIRVHGDGRLFDLYRIFPIVNSVSGFAIFWYVALTRH
jgi:4-hydroxybenzoate polyprenyltransferase